MEEPKDEWNEYTEARFFSDYSSLLLVGHPEVSRVTVYNFDHRRMDSLGRFLPLKKEDNVVKELKQKLKNRLIATSTIQSGDLGQKFISYGREIIDLKTGKRIGIVVLDFNLNYLESEFEQIKLLKSGYVILLDENQQVIYHPNRQIGDVISNKEIPVKISQNYLLEKNEKGNKLLYLRITIPQMEWALIGVVPYEEILEKLLPMHYKFFTFVVIIFLAILFVAISLQKLFVKPIRNLQLMMNKVQIGDFNVRAYFKRNDEIGQLGNSFNSMVKKIDELIIRVYQVELNESRALLFQKQAEIDALQEKITPHFLYNTLNTISWVANRRGVREIEGVVNALSSLLRYSLGDPSKSVTLKDEFDYLNMYSEIIDFRYDGNIVFLSEIDRLVEGTVIPRLTLQPIVENIIKHAFEEKMDEKCIRITAVKTGDMVVIEIEDNGKGISLDRLEEINQKLNQPVRNLVDRISEVKKHKHQEGLGLVNVHHRLKLFFGESYGIVVINGIKDGTVVRITIPFSKESNINSLIADSIGVCLSLDIKAKST